MKKVFKLFAFLLFSVMMANSFIGCGPVWENKVDPTKTQLYVGLYEGGWGSDWLYKAVDVFSDKYPDYQVFVVPKKDEYKYAQLQNSIESDICDVYITECDYNGYIANGSLLEITNAVTEPLSEFGEDESIEAKLPQQYQNFYEYENKYYAVPFGSSIWAINYDVDLFEEESLYFGKNGGWVGVVNGKWTGEKSLGRDGLPNTYDDGTPVTWEEFQKLLNRMRQKQVLPFIWSKEVGYRQNIFLSMYADHVGEEQFNKLLNELCGEFTTQAGEKVEVTPETGYLAAKNDGKRAALDLAYEVISKGYYDTDGEGMKFTEAQDRYLESKRRKTEGSGERIAFLLEGGHWYNEAKATNESYINQFYPEYTEKGRRFSIMPFPQCYGNTSDTATYLESSYEFCMFVNKKTSVPEIAKLFLQFMNSDEMIRLSTRMSGIRRIAQCELEQEDIEAMPYYYQVIHEIASSDKADIVSTLNRTAYYINEPSRRNIISWIYSGTVSVSGKSITLGEPLKTFTDYMKDGLTVDMWMDATINYWSNAGRW